MDLKCMSEKLKKYLSTVGFFSVRDSGEYPLVPLEIKPFGKKQLKVVSWNRCTAFLIIINAGSYVTIDFKIAYLKDSNI